MDKKRVLIICTGNSFRSQMAEGFFRYLAPNFRALRKKYLKKPEISGIES